MQVEIIGPNLPDQSMGQFHVHRVGCRDIARSYPRDVNGHGADWRVEVASVREIVTEIYDDVMHDEDPPPPWQSFESDVHVFPCVDVPRGDEDAHVLDTVGVPTGDPSLSWCETHPDADHSTHCMEWCPWATR